MTKSPLGIWGAQGVEEPARVLAANLVERHNLKPPVDIESLLNECASVSYEDWPYENCDAIVYDLLNERPDVFIRANLPYRRLRLTLGHEFGHIKMAWHFGVLGCEARVSQFEADPLDEARGESVDSPRRLDEQEGEATRFASYLLVPDRYIVPLVAAADMPTLLESLNETEVSADAALMRLRTLLQPGFCFTFMSGGDRRTYTSPGTSLSVPLGNYSLSNMRDKAADFGSVTLSERNVQWFRFAEFERFQPTSDKRHTTAMLRSAIASCESNRSRREKLLLSINGVVGGSLSVDRAVSPAQALAILRHKFDAKSDMQDIVAHADFDLYLRRKVEEWARKRGIAIDD
jgi:IrrE N-terminal-like domain